MKKKHWQHGLRYFVNQFGYLQEMWVNPCGCHPFDVTFRNEFTKRTRWSSGGSMMSFDNHQQISGFIRKQKWMELK